MSYQQQVRIETLECLVDSLRCRIVSIEKSVKDTNRKITHIRNQIRKEKGRSPLPKEKSKKEKELAELELIRKENEAEDKMWEELGREWLE